MSNPAIGEAGRVRAGWERKKDGTWVPIAPPAPARSQVALKPKDVKDVDESLEASHRRMQRALALETLRLERAADKGPLTGQDIEVLARLSTTWRTLIQNEPTPDFGDLSDEQLQAKLAEVKR